MGPKLKLTGNGRGPTEPTGERERTLTFPAMALAQRRLVAAKVKRRPFEGDDAASNPGRTDERHPGDSLARIGVSSTSEVIRRVEETLGLMQRGIDRLKRDDDHGATAFKFPGRTGTDRDDLPPAA